MTSTPHGSEESPHLRAMREEARLLLSARHRLRQRLGQALELPLVAPERAEPLSIAPESTGLFDVATNDPSFVQAAQKLETQAPNLADATSRALISATTRRLLEHLHAQIENLRQVGLAEDAMRRITRQGVGVDAVVRMTRAIRPLVADLAPMVRESLKPEDKVIAEPVALTHLMDAWAGALEGPARVAFLKAERAQEFIGWVAVNTLKHDSFIASKEVPGVAADFHASRQRGFSSRLIDRFSDEFPMRQIAAFAGELPPDLPRSAVDDLLLMAHEKDKFVGKPTEDVAKIVTATVARKDGTRAVEPLRVYAKYGLDEALAALAPDVPNHDVGLLRRVCNNYSMTPRLVLDEWRRSQTPNLQAYLTSALAHGPSFVSEVLSSVAHNQGKPALSADYAGVKQTADKREMKPGALLTHYRESGFADLDRYLQYCAVAHPNSVNHALELARQFAPDADLDAVLEAHERFGTPVRDGLSMTRVGAGFNPVVMSRLHALRQVVMGRASERSQDRAYEFLKEFMGLAEGNEGEFDAKQPFLTDLWRAHQDYHVPLDHIVDFVTHGHTVEPSVIHLYHRAVQSGRGVTITPDHAYYAWKYSNGKATPATVQRVALTQAALEHALRERDVDAPVHPLYAFAIQNHLRGDKLNPVLANPAVLSRPDLEAGPAQRGLLRTFHLRRFPRRLNDQVEVIARRANERPPRGLTTLLDDLSLPRTTSANAPSRFQYVPPARASTAETLEKQLKRADVNESHALMPLPHLPGVDREHVQAILFHGLEMNRGYPGEHKHIEARVRTKLGARFSASEYRHAFNFLFYQTGVLEAKSKRAGETVYGLATKTPSGLGGRIHNQALQFLNTYRAVNGLPGARPTTGPNGPNGKTSGNGGANGK